MAAIASARKARGYPSPASMQHGAVSAVWHGIRRTCGVAQTQKKPLLVPDLRKIADNLDSRLIDTRDRALLLVGFAGAFRRSQIVGLDIEDRAFTDDGLVATLQRSKPIRTATGGKLAFPMGPIPKRALCARCCSVRTMYRLLEQVGESRERRDQLVHLHSLLFLWCENL
jgi:integrase